MTGWDLSRRVQTVHWSGQNAHRTKYSRYKKKGCPTVSPDTKERDSLFSHRYSCPVSSSSPLTKKISRLWLLSLGNHYLLQAHSCRANLRLIFPATFRARLLTILIGQVWPQRGSHTSPTKKSNTNQALRKTHRFSLTGFKKCLHEEIRQRIRWLNQAKA